jgi:hypothetical protein
MRARKTERRHGSPEERFWRFVSPEPTSGCWLWTGGLPNGYGYIGVGNGRSIKACRLSYEMAHGPIPAGLLLRHKCDNRACVNPDHLIPGTYLDNYNDMVERRRDRKACGEANAKARLTAGQVEVARALMAQGVSARLVAGRLGMHRSTLYRIRNGTYWKHIEATAPEAALMKKGA